MPLPNKYLQGIEDLSEWSILTGYRGSIAHGMYVPKSDPDSIDDKDIMSVVVPPLPYFFGLSQYHSRGTREVMYNDGNVLWDVVMYDIRKFMGLLAGGNPNVLMLLWLEPNLYIKRTPAGDALIRERRLFSGKHVYNSFVGYARGQVTRMERGAFKGHMGAKRKELVERFGYDTKNAAHAIRLLRMGVEFLSTGQLNVMRHDAAELLAIKKGEWSLERVHLEAERWFDLAASALIHSTLPERPDRDAVNDLCVHIVQRAMLGFG